LVDQDFAALLLSIGKVCVVSKVWIG